MPITDTAFGVSGVLRMAFAASSAQPVDRNVSGLRLETSSIVIAPLTGSIRRRENIWHTNIHCSIIKLDGVQFMRYPAVGGRQSARHDAHR
jgi:hypothetical protein